MMVITMNSHATLGILGGMGPAAGIDLCRKIVDQHPAHRDQDHIPFILYSVPQIPTAPRRYCATVLHRWTACSTAFTRWSSLALAALPLPATRPMPGLTHCVIAPGCRCSMWSKPSRASWPNASRRARSSA
ncbi:hypothetical protein DRB87_15445 [Pandoraea sp. XY-2]|nr:hypothetical protein DRB87_15445 [Pandoraea sp. XY-2]